MTSLKEISEIDILNNLTNRFIDSNKIFTNINSLLLMINPNKKLEKMFSNKTIEYYIEEHKINSPEIRIESNKPHLYDIILISIENLFKNHNDQSIIINGECGSGKTEIFKYSINCIIYYLLGKNSIERKSNYKTFINKKSIERQIISCNKILESFGNCKTILNDNSSRFGKYLKIFFDIKNKKIIGASIKTFLLEKSRVTQLISQERNFHIFYQILFCENDFLLKKLFITNDPSKYNYLNKNKIHKYNTINDNDLFNETIEAFRNIGFKQEEIDSILKIVVSILLIGNITFVQKNNKIEIENYNIIKDICELLNLDEKTLTTSFESNFNIKDSEYYKNFFAEELYKNLFIWIVKKINYFLNVYEIENDSNIKFISLLDFFGFEDIENNTLEQLCINYTYEKIQNLIYKEYFESEIKEFKNEGLNDKIKNIKYKNNQHIIDLIDYKSNCLFSIIDKCSIENYYIEDFEKLIQKHLIKNKGITLPNNSNNINITIKHSPKEVIYNLVDLIYKNYTDLQKSMNDIFLKSKSEIIKNIFFLISNDIEFDSFENDEKKMKNVYDEKTLFCNNFKNEIQYLINDIKLCECHFIQCLKSNDNKKQFTLSQKILYNQIKYLDLLHFIKNINQSYSIKTSYINFIKEFEILNQEFKSNDNSINNNIIIANDIINFLIPEFDKINSPLNPSIIYGKSKLFLKNDIYFSLQNRKNELLKDKIKACNVIITIVKYLNKLEKIKKYRKYILELQNFFNISKYKIPRMKKINKIYKIQSIFQVNKDRINYLNLIEGYKNLSNIFKTIIQQNINNEKLFKLKCLNIRLMLSLNQNKIKKKELFKDIAKKILNISINNIINREYNNLWMKLSPFFIKFLVKKKYSKTINNIKINQKNFFKNFVFDRFKLKLLFKKIKNKKNSILLLKNYSLAKQSTKYFEKMKKNVNIIQFYLYNILNKEKSLSKIINISLKEEILDKKITNEKIEKAIFPLKIKYKESDAELEEIDNKELNKNLLSSAKSLLSLSTIKLIKEKNSSMKNLHKIQSELKINFINRKSSLQKEKQNEKIRNKILPNYDEFNIPKINLFIKILSIDSIINFADIYEKNWGEDFQTIYKLNMNLNTPIQKISIGNYHTILLNSKGKIFSWGWNNKNQCGININKNNYENYIIPKLNKENKINFPNLFYQNIEKINEKDNYGKIINCFCNEDTTFILNDKGEIYSFGNNNFGQLGLDNYTNYNKPKLIKYLKGKKIIDIQTTNIFTLALTKNNEIYFWFHFEKNKDLKIKNNISKLLNSNLIKIKQISCGYNFCMLLSKNGSLYSMGNNNKGELGLSDKESDLIKFSFIDKPIENLFFSNIYKEKVIFIKCGFKHTICIISSGKIFGWGNNTFGQLGIGNLNNIIYPININIENYILNDKIIQINCGFRSTVFLTENRNIYFCGILDKENFSKIPKKFIIKNKCVEISNEYQFCPVRILMSWNKNASIFYVTFADIRLVYNQIKNIHKVWKIVEQLSKNWNDESILCPYIESIYNYFPTSIMKKD